MTQVLVSEARLPRDIAKYAREFGFLELSCEPGEVPGRARLQACAAGAPAGFVFSLVLPSVLGRLEDGPDTEAAWKLARGAERVLRPGWWVLPTPPSVRPTARARRRLAELVGRLQESGGRVAWQPSGLWEPVAALELADELGAFLVQDVAHEDPVGTGVLYARLLAVGRGARVGHEGAERVARRAACFDEAFVVVEGTGARQVQQAVQRVQRESAEWEDDSDDGVGVESP